MYINTSMYECTRDNTRALCVCVYARSHLDRHMYTASVVPHVCVCVYVYIHMTRIAVQREKREYSLVQARACFGHARAAPLFSLHCVYMYTYGIISTSTNGGLFERVKTYWVGSIECRELIDVTMELVNYWKKMERKSIRFCMIWRKISLESY